MPNLQEHMLRVAAVASIICDNFERPLDKESVISACLIHDVGNIIKFKQYLPFEKSETKKPSRWEKVRAEFIKKYGNNEYKATYKILEEVGISRRVLKLVKAISFRHAGKTFISPYYEVKICGYSDMRVAPQGVLSLTQRLDEGVKRNTTLRTSKFSQKMLQVYISIWEKIEKQIFTRCKIKPGDITEEKVKPLIENLKNFNIQTS